MANNSQLTYQTATIDPTIAGYAAKDPGFALGLLLGRGWVDNYNARGERKLRESLMNKDGSMKTDGTDGTQGTSSATTTGTNQDTGTQGTGTEKPQIFAVNENPVMQAVPKYTIDVNGGSQPIASQSTPSIEQAMMQKVVDGANQQVAQPTAQVATPQADGQGNSLRDRAYAILHDPNNAWSQSAERGAMYNRLAAAGEPGNGNPYAIGNYDDWDRNYQNIRQMNSMAQKYSPTYSVDANGQIVQNAPTGYTATNPLQGMSNYAINTGNANPIQGTDFSNMNLAQLNSYLNGETPQTTPVLDAVQNAQQQNALNAQQTVQPNNNVNFSDAEQDKDSAPVQKDDKQGTTEDVSKTETTEPTVANNATVQPQSVVAQNATTPMVVANNATPTQQPVQLPTIQTTNGAIKPFRMQDWIANVTQAGLAQGRPMNQIQNVIAQLMPTAQAAEENYKNAATNALADRIFRGDESTGGKPLIPNGYNDNVVIPQLLSTLQQMDQINPEYADKIRNILPGAKDTWGQNRGDINKDRDVKYAEQMSDHDMNNSITKAKTLGDYEFERNIKGMVIKHEMEKAWRDKDMADKAKAISAYSGGQITPDQAMFMLLTGGFGGRGGSNGGVQKAANGNNVVNGHVLTSAQQARANELDTTLQRLMDNLQSAMATTTKDDIKNGDDNKVETKDNLAKSIDALKNYYENLEDKDRALIPDDVINFITQALYAGNYRRQYLAGYGNTEDAKNYKSALTPEARAYFNIK